MDHREPASNPAWRRQLDVLNSGTEERSDRSAYDVGREVGIRPARRRERRRLMPGPCAHARARYVPESIAGRIRLPARGTCGKRAVPLRGLQRLRISSHEKIGVRQRGCEGDQIGYGPPRTCLVRRSRLEVIPSRGQHPLCSAEGAAHAFGRSLACPQLFAEAFHFVRISVQGGIGAGRRCVVAVGLRPVVADDVVGDHRPQAVSHDDDSVVHREITPGSVLRMQIPKQSLALAAYGALNGDVFAHIVDVPRDIAQAQQEPAAGDRRQRYPGPSQHLGRPRHVEAGDDQCDRHHDHQRGPQNVVPQEPPKPRSELRPTEQCLG